jgi:hypothetical protein
VTRTASRVAGLAWICVACAALMSGCGASTQARAREREQRLQHARAAVAAEEYATCKLRLGPFIKALAGLKDSLAVGVTDSEYTQRIGDVEVPYSGVEWMGMSAHCRQVGVKAQDALNEHLQSAEGWGRCIEDAPECDDEANSSMLHARWHAAERDLQAAEARLEAIRTGASLPGSTRSDVDEPARGG